MPDETPPPETELANLNATPANPAPPPAEAGPQWPVLQRTTITGVIPVDPNHKFKTGVLPLVTDFVKAHPWARELDDATKHERWQTFLNSLSGVYSVPAPTIVIEPISGRDGEIEPVITDQSGMGDYWVEVERPDGTRLETPVLHMNKYSLLNMLTAFRVYQLATQMERDRANATDDEEGGIPDRNAIVSQAYQWSTSLFYRAAPNRFIRQVHAGHISGMDPDSVTNLLDRTRHVAGPTCPGCRLAEERRLRQERGTQLQQMFEGHETRERDDLSMYM